MWFGFAMGYAYHYGLLYRVMISAERATRYESKFPFKMFVEKPYFISAGDAMGGTISGISGPMGGTAREANADNEAGTAAGNNSVAANFKAFSGKGTSIGGNALPVAERPTYNSQGASASRGRSTPETRAAAAGNSSGAPGG